MEASNGGSKWVYFSYPKAGRFNKSQQGGNNKNALRQQNR